jgi:hypothetical protein
VLVPMDRIHLVWLSWTGLGKEMISGYAVNTSQICRILLCRSIKSLADFAGWDGEVNIDLELCTVWRERNEALRGT